MTTAVVSAALGQLWDAIRHAPAERKTYVEVPAASVLDPDYREELLKADSDYFTVRLSEMFLADRRELWRGFVPMAVSVCDFLYDGAKRSIPFLVNSKILSAALEYAEGNNIEYSNTAMFGPVPYMGGDMALFVGLYRIEADNLGKTLFGVLQEVLGKFGTTALSPYMEMVQPVGNGVAALLGMKEIEFRLGRRVEFSDARLKPGYTLT